MKSIRYLAIGTCFSIPLASAWSPGTRAQAPSANTHAAWTEASTGCGYSPFEPPYAGPSATKIPPGRRPIQICIACTALRP